MGCDCPDEVFAHILIESPSDALARLSIKKLVKVGGRLMVAVCRPPTHTDGLDKLQHIFDTGKKLRDLEGFNRFRLVIIADNPEQITPTLHDRFAQLAGLDDRIHLHVTSLSALPDCLR